MKNMCVMFMYTVLQVTALTAGRWDRNWAWGAGYCIPATRSWL